MAHTVAILGGGIGGLSAAHELAERGFEVVVLEGRSAPGGKARSMPVPGSGVDGRADLPAEHGFRFFPGYGGYHRRGQMFATEGTQIAQPASFQSSMP